MRGDDLVSDDERRERAFLEAYENGKFFPFKYFIRAGAGSEVDHSDLETWCEPLQLNKTQLALLERMLCDIDVSVMPDECGVRLVFFNMRDATMAVGNLSRMILDGYDEADSGYLEALRKFRDMIVRETEALEKRIENKEVP